ncbi:MAG: FtsX-like permease family protein [Roseivirga sp.]|nr:FtsX-like permease family protein [Roseivirga sp.]
MLRFIKLGFRSLKRERFFASVNLAGLTLGMFCFLVTALYVRDELLHDKWHENGDDIYRARIEFNRGNGAVFNLFPSINIVEGLKEESPGVVNAVNISLAETAHYLIGRDRFETEKLFYSQPALFSMFDFGLKLGDEQTALEPGKSVVISDKLARKHFGKENPIGELIEIEDKGTYKVTGVLKPIPSQSHLRFDLILPIDFSAVPYVGAKDSWVTGSGLNYFQLQEGYTPEKLKADVIRLLEKHEAKEYGEMYEFARFSELYMGASLMRNSQQNMFGGQMKYIYIFSVVGVLILVVACFNYINLTTARSFARAKEIGVRKIIGASRSRLVLSQMAETFFLALLALVVALIFLELSLGSINAMIGKELDINILNDPQVAILPMVLLLLVVLISGIYPAITASTFNLSTVLKGNNPKSNVSFLRKTLVVLQFLICAGLLSGALVIRGQAEHMVNMDLGYNAQNILSLDLRNDAVYGKYKELRAELEKIPQISKVSGSPMPDLNSVLFIEKDEEGNEVNLSPFYGVADKDFNELFELEIIAGTDFSGVSASELKGATLMNETALKSLGWEDPIGKKIAGMTIVGVMKDFLFRSAKNKISPAMIVYNATELGNLQFRFREGDREAVLTQVEEVWNEFAPDEPFVYEEISSFFAGSYTREENLVKIFDVLTLFLAVVAFLGLFALSTFESQLREKEIGIRKVLGASYMNLISTLNRRFMTLILIAMAASVPLSYMFINKWLDDFPYRIDSTVPYFGFALISILLLATLLLSIHGFLNSRKNPASVLRNQ